MEQAIVFGIFALILAGAAGLALVFVRRLQKLGLPRILRVAMGTLMPISLIVLTLYVWHVIDYARYEACGIEEGYMSPLVILLYGFPYIILIVIASFVAALRADRRA